MKHILLTALISAGIISSASAQITITANDMPVVDDTLRSSAASPLANLDLTTTGANTTWDFSALTPVSQTVDEYKSATSVNPLYVFTYANSYGIGADLSALTGGQQLPIPVSNPYLFFAKKTGPSRFIVDGYGAEFTGVGVPIDYSDEDEQFFFPLEYADHDSSTFAMDFDMSGVGGIKIEGTRHTEVDGWGTITTPYFTTAEPCIRVRSVAVEVDSIILTTGTVGIPRTTIEYRWMVNGEHYPALWVTANEILGVETVSSVRYRDNYRMLTNVGSLSPSVRELALYPNPATGNTVKLDIPANWKNYSVELFDITGKCIAVSKNNAELNTAALAKGNYIVRVMSGTEVGMAKLTK